MAGRRLVVVFLFVLFRQAPGWWSGECGNLQIPFPFVLNSSNDSSSIIGKAFHLYCINSTSLFLNLSGRSFRILEFLLDAVLVDFPGRHYNDSNAFDPLSANPFFAVSNHNLLTLYDCNDSSLCQNLTTPICDGATCCYPLTHGSLWPHGCRGFSSWVVDDGSTAKPGLKLEWGIPRNLSRGICDPNAFLVNATALPDAVRCSCSPTFVGDGFARGFGCFKSKFFPDFLYALTISISPCLPPLSIYHFLDSPKLILSPNNIFSLHHPSSFSSLFTTNSYKIFIFNRLLLSTFFF